VLTSRKRDGVLRKRSRRPPKPSLKRAFLSHAAADRPFVRRLAEVLRDYRIPCWYSEDALVGAHQWHDQIGRALRKCDWIVLVLSPRSIRSRWVKRELLYALDDPRYEERIIPVLYRACNSDRLSWVLRSFQRVDFTQDFDRGASALLRVWGKRYQRRSSRKRSQHKP
jgi:hypothetical protein